MKSNIGSSTSLCYYLMQIIVLLSDVQRVQWSVHCSSISSAYRRVTQLRSNRNRFEWPYALVVQSPQYIQICQLANYKLHSEGQGTIVVVCHKKVRRHYSKHRWQENLVNVIQLTTQLKIKIWIHITLKNICSLVNLREVLLNILIRPN